ncbi:dna helicase [Ophiostoma piceae UAMH 11346]|uniref:Dna helicase n=1 Tax=Ophiostoma piceae (strain UAMH 11346) TaxID=1262450 RepID=S3BTJ9_OPHP1|nr:dna helicase [Ophiostoma piceae UAMH 11346]
MGSRFNAEQNKACVRLVDLLLAQDILAADITCITPYRANAAVLSDALAVKASTSPVTVYTADSFQGRENEIVILVLCVTKTTGACFVANLDRLCVALTRYTTNIMVQYTLKLGPRFRSEGPVKAMMDGTFFTASTKRAQAVEAALQQPATELSFPAPPIGGSLMRLGQGGPAAGGSPASRSPRSPKTPRAAVTTPANPSVASRPPAAVPSASAAGPSSAKRKRVHFHRMVIDGGDDDDSFVVPNRPVAPVKSARVTRSGGAPC